MLNAPNFSIQNTTQFLSLWYHAEPLIISKPTIIPMTLGVCQFTKLPFSLCPLYKFGVQSQNDLY